VVTYHFTNGNILFYKALYNIESMLVVIAE
jgi:hypothetical protein